MRSKKIAVVGAGPAGLSAATVLAERGHRVELFDGAAEIGGQLNMAKQVPGKEEFFETIRYFSKRLEHLGVHVSLNTRVDAKCLIDGGFDDVILATGVHPRNPKIPGQDHPMVLNYVDVLLHKKPVGQRVAIIGAGGIGFDVAEFLTHEGTSSALDLEQWLKEWGVVDPEKYRGGLDPKPIHELHSPRHVTILQRTEGKLGNKLGKTTGWIHRATLKKKGVASISGVNYEQISDRGLQISHGPKRKDKEWLSVDNIILCAGQEPSRDLLEPLLAAGISAHVIGGADVAAELDAKRAIDQGSRLAAHL